MKRIKQLLLTGFDSSSTKTPEFLSFARLFKNDFKKELQTIGATLEAYSVGHFYVSGFFKLGEQLFYFSLPDVRMFNVYAGGHFNSLLVRTATHLKDYSGGSNTYTDGVKEGMMKEWLRLSKHFGYIAK